MEYVNIDKSLIPYRFNIKLSDETYTFEMNYNERYDFFTINLFKNEVPIILGEKIVYGKPLFTSYDHLGIPRISILPFDLSGNTDRLTYENFNEQVFLYLVEGDNE